MKTCFIFSLNRNLLRRSQPNIYQTQFFFLETNIKMNSNKKSSYHRLLLQRPLQRGGGACRKIARAGLQEGERLSRRVGGMGEWGRGRWGEINRFACSPSLPVAHSPHHRFTPSSLRFKSFFPTALNSFKHRQRIHHTGRLRGERNLSSGARLAGGGQP
jgi:hypothetical protein